MKPGWYLGHGVYVEQVEANRIKLSTEDNANPQVIYLNIASCVSLFAYVKEIVSEQLKNEHKPTTT